MQTVTLKFNYPEDDNIHFNGTVKFNNDFGIGGREEFRIRGLGEWRRVKADTIHVSQDFLQEVLTPNRLRNFEGSGLRVEGLKTDKSDIQLSFELRQKGPAAVKAQLEKFFKTLSSAAVVEIENLASDEE